MEPPVLFLDLSRLVRRFANGGGPTGIDRIELNYAAWMTRQDAFRAVPVARHRRSLRTLKGAGVAQMVAALTARWSGEGAAPALARPLRLAAGALRAERLFASPLDAGGAKSVYLNVGHDGLDVAERYAPLPGAFAALISDVIPITHPEYDTPRATRLQRLRVETLARHADHVSFVSAAARDALASVSPPARYTTSVAHLAPGLAPLPRRPSETATFVHLSSLDRRKNVPLLLHVWRDLAHAGGPVPRLVLIGRAGNDATAAALLTRCEALAQCVTAVGALDDGRVAQHLAGAAALLSPSFVEGFGLPVIEARAAGVPVIASDIAAHREIGGPHAVLLDPLDGPAWREAILAAARDRPQPPLETVPTWCDHFAAMTATLRPLAR